MTPKQSKGQARRQERARELLKQQGIDKPSKAEVRALARRLSDPKTQGQDEPERE